MVCGFEPGEGATRYYPAPPSFARARVQVLDENAKRYYGYATAETMRDGGVDFKLRFENASARREHIRWHIEYVVALPDATEARVLDPGAGAWEDMARGQILELEPGGSQYRFLAVGSRGYLDAYKKNALASGARLLGVSPNPFTGRLLIRYVLPYSELRQCRFTIYDLKGRMVWEKALSQLYPGVSAVAWDATVDPRRPASSGVYIVQMKVIYGAASRVKQGVFRQRITYIP
jgi:hypothetical protein